MGEYNSESSQSTVPKTSIAESENGGGIADGISNVTLHEFILRLSDRIFRAHEVLALRAERRKVVITELNYPCE